MADLAKDKKEILEADEKISVTMKDNKVCTSISMNVMTMDQTDIIITAFDLQVGKKCVVDPVISGLLPTLAKGKYFIINVPNKSYYYPFFIAPQLSSLL